MWVGFECESGCARIPVSTAIAVRRDARRCAWDEGGARDLMVTGRRDAECTRYGAQARLTLSGSRGEIIESFREGVCLCDVPQCVSGVQVRQYGAVPPLLCVLRNNRF